MQRIIVIDDEPSIRRTLEVVLTRAGYEVLLAGSGIEGIALCRAAVPDLVITDIHMPGGDGFETIAALRAVSTDLPIIAISGSDEVGRLELRGNAALLGAVSTLKKPFTVHELLDAVRPALDQRLRADEA